MRDMKRKRFIIVAATVIVVFAVVGSLILWAVLSAWVPTKGKAWVIRTVERSAPVELTIESVRYELLRGLLLDDVHVVNRNTQEAVAHARQMRVQIHWLALLAGQAAFNAQVSLTAPCATDVALGGHVHLRRKALTLDLRTENVPLSSIGPPLVRHIPLAITDGILRATIRLAVGPQHPLSITGRLDAERLTWVATPLKIQGDLTVDGSMTAPSSPGTRWDIQTVISLRRGEAQGVPTVHTVTQMEGTGRLTSTRLEIERLEGTAFGFRWELEGELAPLPPAAVEFLVRSRVDLDQLPEPLASRMAGWQATGQSDLQAECRGPLQPTIFLDCLAQADVRRASVRAPRASTAITDLTGRLAYDMLTKLLTVSSLTGRLGEQPLSVEGGVTLTQPPTLALDVRGTLPLDAVAEWLPPQPALQQMAGTARVDVHLAGALPRVRVFGEAHLQDASTRLAALPHALEHVNGLILFAEQRIDLEEVSLRVQEQPLTLDATARLEATPRLTATLGFDRGQLSLAGRLTPEDIVIDDGRLAFEQSRLQFTGTYARRPQRPSAISANGTVDLGTLHRLPFVPLPAVEAWKLTGIADGEAQWVGAFADWPNASIRARIRSEHASVRTTPLEGIVCTIEQERRALRVGIPSARVADGSLSGQLTIEHRQQTHDYLLEADLVALQLAKLAQLVPAWRNREVSGIASAHTTAFGAWEDRASWRGEGWLSVSGQGLGDVPLLDKVFRGLFGMLGDRLGLESLRRAQITEASVRWRLAEERLWTEDLRLGGVSGTEPVAVYARGSVGLDQTLDFVIEPELSEGVVLEAPTTSTLARTVLKAAGQLERLRQLIGRHRLTGTLKQPEYRFEFGTQEVLKQVAPAPADLLQNLLDAVR